MENPQIDPTTPSVPAEAAAQPASTQEMQSEFNKLMGRRESQAQESTPLTSADPATAALLERQRQPGYDPDAYGADEHGIEIDGGL